jgi:2-polyprenyl-3-methyl-5-hydroxy-6-metoxy-1,4-benzoquinol methylase
MDRYARHNRGRGRGFVFGGDERAAAMRSLLPRNFTTVLDLGCRDGALARSMGLSGRRIVGVDIDMEALRVARDSRTLQPVCANLWAPTIPLTDTRFDVVLAGELLEHIPFPDGLVVEIARVLHPRGRVIGSVPNAFRLKNRLIFLAGRSYERDPTHFHQFSPKSLKDLLEARFRTVSIHPRVGRVARWWPRMTANDLVWAASDPSPAAISP